MFMADSDGTPITDSSVVTYDSESHIVTIYAETLDEFYDDAVTVTIIAHVVETSVEVADANLLNSVSFNFDMVDPCLTNEITIEPISDDFEYDDSDRLVIYAHLRLEQTFTLDALTAFEVINSFDSAEICGDLGVAFEVDGVSWPFTGIVAEGDTSLNLDINGYSDGATIEVKVSIELGAYS